MKTKTLAPIAKLLAVAATTFFASSFATMACDMAHGEEEYTCNHETWLNVFNHGGNEITEIYISESSDQSWGPDLLSGVTLQIQDMHRVVPSTYYCDPYYDAMIYWGDDYITELYSFDITQAVALHFRDGEIAVEYSDGNRDYLEVSTSRDTALESETTYRN